MTTIVTNKASALDDLRLQYMEAATAVKNIKDLGQVLSEKKSKEEVLKILNTTGRKILRTNHEIFNRVKKLISVKGSTQDKENMTKLYNDAFIPALRDVIGIIDSHKIS